MKRTHIGEVILLLMLVLSALQPIPEPAHAAAPPDLGRVTVTPPTNTTEWNISGEAEILSCCTFAGNITVFSNGILRIKSESTLSVPHNASAPWTLLVKPGGYVEVTNSSVLSVDQFQTESGAGLQVDKGSRVYANGLFNATASSLTITDSAVTVTGDPECPATLILNAGSGGSIQRSKLTVTAGDGVSGVDGYAGDGGHAMLVITSQNFDNDIIVAQAGKGANGGIGIDGMTGTAGGRGGSLYVRVTGNTLTRSNFTLKAGDGGAGADGMGSASGGGSAGSGGSGGGVDFGWTGASIRISSSNLTATAGNGGRGGKGGEATQAGKNGGNGREGGRGGTIDGYILNSGSMTVTDSDVFFGGGFGPTGGNYGRAGSGGIDGKAGDGGVGGGATLQVSLQDSFTGKNCTLVTAAGNGGSGGIGSSGGKGGNGGSGSLNITIAKGAAEPAFSYNARTLACRGGNGGAGGKGVSIGQIQGQPGDGGKGGGARLTLDSGQSINISNTEVVCDEGSGGVADKPAVTGNPGLGEPRFLTGTVNILRSNISQTMGPVDGNDRWTLDSSPIRRPLHFDVSDAGIAEEYWHLTVRVKDITGNLVTDGSVIAEVLKNESLVDSKRTDAFGKAEFRLLGSKYTAAGQERMTGYKFMAHDDRGRFSRNQSCEMISDLSITTTLLEGGTQPHCSISAPDAKITPIIDATAFLKENGLSDPYIIEGDAVDDIRNYDPSIDRIQLKISDDGEWMDVQFFPTQITGKVKWNYTWDIYNWAAGKLSKYPLGTIPCPIYARSYNGRLWSDNPAYGGSATLANITVWLHKIPPRLPEVAITQPADSTRSAMGEFNVTIETPVSFNARIVNSNRTKVIKWVWDFDDSNGLQEDYSSPVSPETTHSFPKDKADTVFKVTLKVFDNESAKRVDLLRSGVSYDEFGYEFDTTDGSINVTLRIYVKPVGGFYPTPSEPLFIYRIAWWGPLAAFSLLLVGIGVVGYIAGTETALWSFLMLIVVPLYTKLKRIEVLDHITRGKILGFITATPGCNYNQMKTRLGLKNDTLAYHLAVLEREEYIKSRNDGNLRRFYPIAAKLKPVTNGLSDIQLNILDKIRERPGQLTQSELVELLGKSQQVVSYHVQQLRRAGMIRSERVGGVSYYTIIKDVK